MIYFDKARELGNLLLESEQSKRLERARSAYEADTESAAAFAEYNEQKDKLQNDIKQGKLSRDEYTEALKGLTELQGKLKENTLINDFGKAEAEFYALVSQTLEIIKATVMGESEDDCGCGGECGGCEGCK